MERKAAVYLCQGCGIGESLDAVKLQAVTAQESKGALCRTHGAFCSPEGVAVIRQDLAQEGVNAALIAACSPRVNYDVFDFGPDTPVERVNLREQVVWSQPPQQEETQRMAEDYLRMGWAKLQRLQPLVPSASEEFSKTVLVVGGGITGLTAAWEAARAGYPVILVEKQPALGGFARQLYRRLPTQAPYWEPEPVGLPDLIQRVSAHPQITVLTGAEVAKTVGGPGLFDIEIAHHGQVRQERVGAIVLATGWQPYDAAKLTHLGYGTSPHIVSSVQVEELAQSGRLQRPSDGGPLRRVLFIQCAGSRDENHLPYCSSICCAVSMKQALYLKEQYPKAEIYVLYQELRTPGEMEDFYRRAQQEGVVFIKGMPAEIRTQEGEGVTVEIRDASVRDPVRLANLDLVVLAVGMVPSTAAGTPDGIASLLNLQYLQGPELPRLKYGFADSHFLCFPYETQRTGIYTAGPVRWPMGIAGSLEDARGATLKAIQCIEMTKRGASVHPRSGDLTYPVFFMQKCTSCGRCTQECPFGALELDEQKHPVLNPGRCRRCGICMGACPVQIISFHDYSVESLGAMIKAVEIPEEEVPRVLVLACENDAYPALDMAGIARLTYPAFVRTIPVRCLGSVNSILVADALARGFDGILLMGCRHGDDYQCHFIRGSLLLETRMANIRETLDRLALGADRVKVEEVGIADSHRIPEVIGDFLKHLAPFGPNPFKGF
jgi:quinone-modifying oxidoreductase subunit QmoB